MRFSPQPSVTSLCKLSFGQDPRPPPAAERNLLLATLPDRRDELAALGASCTANALTIVTCGEALKWALEFHPPRMLLIDVELCRNLGTERLSCLRGLGRATKWVLTWPAPSPSWLDIVRVTQACGAVSRNATPYDAARALNAVLAGELWFPRSVLASLYVSLLHTHGSDEVPGIHTDDDADAVAALTRREAQVLSLVREGLTNKEIAQRLAVSANTVKKQLASAFRKRGLKSRRQTLAGAI